MHNPFRHHDGIHYIKKVPVQQLFSNVCKEIQAVFRPPALYTFFYFPMRNKAALYPTALLPERVHRGGAGLCCFFPAGSLPTIFYMSVSPQALCHHSRACIWGNGGKGREPMSYPCPYKTWSGILLAASAEPLRCIFRELFAWEGAYPLERERQFLLQQYIHALVESSEAFTCAAAEFGLEHADRLRALLLAFSRRYRRPAPVPHRRAGRRFLPQRPLHLGEIFLRYCVGEFLRQRCTNGAFECERIFCERFSPFEGEYGEYLTEKGGNIPEKAFADKCVVSRGVALKDFPRFMHAFRPTAGTGELRRRLCAALGSSAAADGLDSLFCLRFLPLVSLSAFLHALTNELPFPPTLEAEIYLHRLFARMGERYL